MNKKWILGFIEGSGCFSVVIRKSRNKVGYQTTADFTLKLPQNQEELLERIHTHLGIGRVYSSKKESVLKSTSLEDAKKLVRFLSKTRFLSHTKRREFNAWRNCIELIEKGVHLTPQGVLGIARLRDTVHVKNLWNKKNYCILRKELDPCQMHREGKMPEGCRICLQQ